MKKLWILSGLCLMLGQSAVAQVEHRSFLELDGVAQYLEVPPHRELGIGPEDSYTQTFWFRGSHTITYAPTQRIISQRLTAPAHSLGRSGYDIVVLRNTAKNFVGVDLIGTSGTTNDGLSLWANSVGKAELLEWHHVAVVISRSSGKLYIYVDGQLQAEKELSATEPWQTTEGISTFIGCGTEGGKPNAFFGGQLDNVRFYRRALTAEEIGQDLRTELVSKRTAGLVAAFDFEHYRAGDTTIVDETGRHRAAFRGQTQTTTHRLVRTLVNTPTNNLLIGRGPLQALQSLTLGLSKQAELSGLRLSLEGTTSLTDVESVKVFMTDRAERFDHRKPGILLLEGCPATDGSVRLKPVQGRSRVLPKHAKLWVVADIKSSAAEGGKLVSRVEAIEFKDGRRTLVFDASTAKTMEHEIVLTRTLVWAPGDNHSAHYRIPALVRLNSGTLVAAIDKRKNSEYDLPEDIDVEVKLSHDNGLTWSEPITVAKGTPEHGYGDAAIATDGETLHMVMVAGSGLWFYPSAADKPLEMYYTKSIDGGKTWEPVREITQQVYTHRYPNGGFFGSGNGIVTKDGRIAFVAAMRIDAKWGGQLDNVLVYSDDAGRSWHSSPVARANGDEAKVLELADGSLLVSSRNRAYSMTPRTYVRSTDGGKTWTKPAVWEDLQGNACNAALARYSLATEKGGKNIILHTLLEANNRSNLRIYMSEDEGKTWPWARTLCAGEAAYSEIAILPDGTIGIISEENDRPGFDIYFTRISLDWLRRGKNKYNK